MPKPSIFSNKYDEQMKKRKRNKIILISSLIVILLGAFIIHIKNILCDTNKISEKQTQIVKKQKSDINEIKGKDNQVKEQHEKINEKNRECIIKLQDGTKLKSLYDLVDNKKIYTGIIGNNIKYNISPSKKSIAVMVNQDQKIILVDENGKNKEITKQDYVSTRGETFSREEIMKSNPNYIWCDNPQFLNDDNIVYVSQLPWFNKPNTKYLWKYNISSNTYTNDFSSIGEICGDSIEFGALTNEGLEVIVDGTKKIIK